MAVQPVPEGYHTLTPCMMVAGAAKLIDFLRDVFGAVEVERYASPDGAIMHAEVTIGDSRLMFGDVRGSMAPVVASLYAYVPDVDATYARAVAAGSTSLLAPFDQFYGDRKCGVRDPFGNTWWIATRVEDVPPAEMARRAQEYAAKQAAQAKK